MGIEQLETQEKPEIIIPEGAWCIDTVKEKGISRENLRNNEKLVTRPDGTQVLEIEETAKNISPLPTYEQNEWETHEKNRYAVEQRPFAEGGSARLYRGVDTKMDREVAIKVPVGEEGRLLIEREAKILARLPGRNLGFPEIYDITKAATEQTVNPELVIIMEYLDPKRYINLYEKKENYPIEDVLEIIEGVAQALDWCHEHKLVHKDIKPRNILYSEEDKQVKVLDLGDAFYVGELPSEESGITPGFAAPEAYDTEHPISPKEDIFSFGTLVHVLLTNNHRSQQPNYNMELKGKYADLTEYTSIITDRAQARQINKTIKKAVSLRPEQRQKTCMEIVDEIKLALGMAVDTILPDEEDLEEIEKTLETVTTLN